LYIPEYRILSGGENLRVDPILDWLNVKIPAPLSTDISFIISVGDVFDGDLNLIKKSVYDTGIHNSTNKSLEVFITNGSTKSEDVYLIDADGTKETERGIRISVEYSVKSPAMPTIGTAYLDVCVTNCPPFIYMQNQYMSYHPSGSAAVVGETRDSKSEWYVYDSHRDLVPQDGYSGGRDFIVTNNIISISGYMATSGEANPYDNVTNGVLKFLWSPGTETLTTRHYFQSIDKDGGVGKKFFQLTRVSDGRWSIIE
jgi:hypothetical protein